MRLLLSADAGDLHPTAPLNDTTITANTTTTINDDDIDDNKGIHAKHRKISSQTADTTV